MKFGYRVSLPIIIVALIIAGIILLARPVFIDHSAENGPKPSSSEPIVLVWELAGIESDYDSIGPMEPVEVVSPTWFHLSSAKGEIRSDFDPEYLDWARERGYQVWALVTNSFDPDLTASLLSNAELRRQFAGDLVKLAVKYELEGLNIDFENFHKDYRDHFTLLVQELAALCKEYNLVLSVNITMISGSEYWSQGYDRAKLAAAADYLVLMAYDEHWASSPNAGSVASLPWVEQGLKLILNDVPSEKLILGVPFYTRLWEIDESTDPATVLNSWSYSMMRAEEIIANNQAEIYSDDHAGQNVAEYKKEGLTYRMWLEDKGSMQKRLELIDKYNLAGVAAWRRGLEKHEIWEIFKTFLGG